MLDHSFFMRKALQEAQLAFEENEIPVGAVLVCQNQVIAKAHNLTQHLNDVTAHAEIQVITAAANFLSAKYLHNCTLYVTVEPCIMCAGALGWAQVAEVVYGASDNKKGFTNFSPSPLHPKTTIVKDVMLDECTTLMKTFFRNKR